MTNNNLNIRWMIRRDMPAVLAIEQLCFSNPWTQDDFIAHMRQRFCIGMVVEYEQSVIGFMIYELHKHHLQLINLAVAPAFRYRGAGSTMIAKLISKLSPNRRRRLAISVRETNLDAQLFFKKLGLRAVEVLRDQYSDTDEDSYLMVYDSPSSYPTEEQVERGMHGFG